MNVNLMAGRSAEVADLEWAINHCLWFLHYKEGAALYQRILDLRYMHFLKLKMIN